MTLLGETYRLITEFYKLTGCLDIETNYTYMDEKAFKDLYLGSWTYRGKPKDQYSPQQQLKIVSRMLELQLWYEGH